MTVTARQPYTLRDVSNERLREVYEIELALRPIPDLPEGHYWYRLRDRALVVLAELEADRDRLAVILKERDADERP